MRITALLLIILVSFSFGASIDEVFAAYPHSSDNGISQKDIHTYKDYKELETKLLQLSMQGVPQGDFYLGLLYENSFHIENNTTIPMKLEKAFYHFQKAYTAGNLLSAYHLAMISVYQKKPLRALRILDDTLAKKELPRSLQVLLANQYGMIVLDYLPNNRMLLQRAMRYLRPMASEKLPTSAFVYANILNILGDEASANRYLNMACKSPYASKELIRRCFNGGNIEVIKKGSNCNASR